MSLQAALQPGAPPEALDASVEATRAELHQSRQQVIAALAAESDQLRSFIGLEADTVERSFLDYFHLLELCQRYREAPAGEDWLESARANLGLVQQRLNLSLERLRESLLAERGPFTHPGVNRVLQAADRAEALRAAVDEELSRLDLVLGTGQLGQQLRRELLPEELAAYPQMQHWLEAAPEEGLPEPAWLAEGQRLGQAFARCDRDFVRRHYQRTPTSMPALNLVLHALHFHAQGSLTRSALDYFQTEARASLANLRQRLQQHQPEGAEQVLQALDRLSLEEPTALLQQIRALEAAVSRIGL